MSSRKNTVGPAQQQNGSSPMRSRLRSRMSTSVQAPTLQEPRLTRQRSEIPTTAPSQELNVGDNRGKSGKANGKRKRDEQAHNARESSQRRRLSESPVAGPSGTQPTSAANSRNGPDVEFDSFKKQILEGFEKLNEQMLEVRTGTHVGEEARSELQHLAEQVEAALVLANDVVSRQDPHIADPALRHLASLSGNQMMLSDQLNDTKRSINQDLDINAANAMTLRLEQSKIFGMLTSIKLSLKDLERSTKETGSCACNSLEPRIDYLKAEVKAEFRTAKFHQQSQFGQLRETVRQQTNVINALSNHANPPTNASQAQQAPPQIQQTEGPHSESGTSEHHPTESEGSHSDSGTSGLHLRVIDTENFETELNAVIKQVVQDSLPAAIEMALENVTWPAPLVPQPTIPTLSEEEIRKTIETAISESPATTKVMDNVEKLGKDVATLKETLEKHSRAMTALASEAETLKTVGQTLELSVKSVKSDLDKFKIETNITDLKTFVNSFDKKIGELEMSKVEKELSGVKDVVTSLRQDVTKLKESKVENELSEVKKIVTTLGKDITKLNGSKMEEELSNVTTTVASLCEKIGNFDPTNIATGLTSLKDSVISLGQKVTRLNLSQVEKELSDIVKIAGVGKELSNVKELVTSISERLGDASIQQVLTDLNKSVTFVGETLDKAGLPGVKESVDALLLKFDKAKEHVLDLAEHKKAVTSISSILDKAKLEAALAELKKSIDALPSDVPDLKAVMETLNDIKRTLESLSAPTTAVDPSLVVIRRQADKLERLARHLHKKRSVLVHDLEDANRARYRLVGSLKEGVRKLRALHDEAEKMIPTPGENRVVDVSSMPASGMPTRTASPGSVTNSTGQLAMAEPSTSPTATIVPDAPVELEQDGSSLGSSSTTRLQSSISHYMDNESSKALSAVLVEMETITESLDEHLQPSHYPETEITRETAEKEAAEIERMVEDVLAEPPVAVESVEEEGTGSGDESETI